MIVFLGLVLLGHDVLCFLYIIRLDWLKFAKNFCLYVHEGYCKLSFLLSFSGFGMRVMLAS